MLQGVEALNDKQQRYASNIQRSGQILLEMINEILDLAKIEAGKQEIRPVDMDLSIVVRAQCDLVKSLVEEKNLSLDIKELMQDSGFFRIKGNYNRFLPICYPTRSNLHPRVDGLPSALKIARTSRTFS